MSRAPRIRMVIAGAVIVTAALVWLSATLQKNVAQTRGERLQAVDQLLLATLREEFQLRSDAGTASTSVSATRSRPAATIATRSARCSRDRGRRRGRGGPRRLHGAARPLGDAGRALAARGGCPPSSSTSARASSPRWSAPPPAAHRRRRRAGRGPGRPHAPADRAERRPLPRRGRRGRRLSRPSRARPRAVNNQDQKDYVTTQSEFAETLQLLGDEQEAHQLVKRHLERALPAATATILSRNNSANRLEATTEPPSETEVAKRLTAGRRAARLPGHPPRPAPGARAGRDSARCPATCAAPSRMRPPARRCWSAAR